MSPRPTVLPAFDVLLTEVQGEGVLVDVVGNRFFGLTRLSTRLWSLASRLQVHELQQTIASEFGLSAEDARTLIARELDSWEGLGLTRSSRGQRVPRSPKVRNLPAASGDLSAGYRGRLVARDFGDVAVAFVLSRYWLWRFGVAGALLRVQALNLRGHESDFQHGCVKAQVRLRALLFRGRSDCFLQAITLAVALRRRGHDATLCIGLLKFPFRAHAWVELDGVVLTDTVDFVHEFELAARY